MRIAAVVCSCCLLLGGVVVQASDFQLGVSAYQQQDYETAYREFFELAQQGHIDAQNNLGVLYNTGRGVAQDYVAAANWYRKAAEQGHAAAQTNLGILYAGGQGVPQDDMLAYAWTSIAAQQGTEKALMYRDQVAARLSQEQLAQAQQLSLVQPQMLPLSQPQPVSSVPAAAVNPTFKSTNSAATKTQQNGAVYGPVAAGETLWSIASRLKPLNISTQQMMLAIQRLNPQAFATGKINSLKAAVSLRIPDAAEAGRVTAEQAKAELQKQLQ